MHCTARCQCTNCKNQGLPATEGNDDELAILALEEEVTTTESSLVDDEFSEFVFASQYDSDSS